MSAWKKKALLVVTFIAVGALAKVIGERAGDETFRAFTRSTVSIEDQVRAVAAQLDKSTPYRVDDVTTLTRVEAAGSAFVYRYRLDYGPADVSKEDFQTFFTGNILPGICANEQMVSEMRRGITYRYVYELKNASPLFEFTVSGGLCPR